MAGNERGGLDQRAAREAERPPGREQRAPQRPRDRLDETRLPTPPLDPWLSQWYLRNVQQQQPRSLDEDEDMLAFFADLETPPSDSQASDCPSRNSTASTITVPNLCLEEAFEHLNRLYSLTEQILELRHRTSTFFKRVRNLEKLKVLRNANRALEDVFAADYEDAGDFCEEDTGFADSLLNAMISNCREPPFQRRNVRVSASRRARGRFDFQKQSSGDEGSKDAPKVSKWTRVKAAFKWERAYANDAAEAAENATAPTSPITPTARFLSVPEIEAGNSGSSSPSFYVDDVSDAGTSFSRTSTVSLSNEAACECARKRRDLCPARGASPDRNLLPGSLGGTQSHLEPRAKEEPRELRGNRRSLSLDRNVATDAEQANDNGPAKQIRVAEEKNGTACPSNAIDEKGARSTPKRPPPSLTITIPSLNDDIRCVPSPESNSSVSSSAHTPSGNSPLLRNMQREQSSAKHFKRQQSVIEESIASRIRGQDSKWSKVRRAFLTNSPLSIPPSPVKVGSRQMFLQNGQECSTPASCSASAEDLEQLTALNTQSDTQRDYRVLREKLGAEFHRKLVEWERMKNLSPRPQTKDSVREAAPSFANPREHFLSEERLSFEFRKKLQDWKRVKKERRGSNAFEQQRFNRRRLTDWQLWKSPAKAECRNREIAGQRANFAEGVNGGRSHLSEDFLRKMDVWKRMHETGNGDDEHSRAKFSRLGIGSGIDETEFLTLEKALAQFNRDTVKQRRETDRQQSDKFVDANAKSYADAARDSSCTDEVLVQTSAGSYRFEGISREFTRKLYDWEKYRGISPRSSTFRLLGPAFDPLLRESDVETPITPTTKAGSSEQVFFSDRNLTRSKSADDLITRSSLSESFIRRPTSLQLLNRVASTLEDSDVTGSLLLSSNRQGVEEIAEDILMDDSEPEAMIVDIEDVIEETASPLKRMQPHQTPVYSVAASETTSIAVPLGTVTSSHEPSPVLFIEIEDKPNRKQRQDRRNNSPRGSDSSSRNLESANASSRYSSSRENVDSGCSPFLDVTNRNKRRDDDSVCFARDDDARKDPGKASDAIGRDRTARIAEMSTKLEEPVEKVEAVPAPADERRPVDGVAEEQRLDGSDECETVRRWNLGTHSAFARSVKESTDLSSEEKHCREDDDDRETVEDGGSCLVRDVAEVLAEPDNEYENVKSGEDPYYCSLVDRRPATNYETCDRETFSGSLATYKLESANYENLRHANQENEDPSPNLSKPFNLFKIKSSVFERIPFESHAKRLSPGGRNKSPEAATPIKSKLSSDQLKQRKLETTSTPISPSKSPCNGDYNRNQTTRATPPTINEDARPKSTALSAVKGCTGSSKALHRSIDVPAEIDAAHIHDPGSTIDDPRALNNDAGRAIEEPAIAEKPKKQYSPTRNVLMKTKRMIFSPFRREEDYNSRRKNSNSSDSDQAYSLKTIAKSRSTSPKINRPDMLTRMSFSLPWPLGSSSKDHESKAPRDGPEIAYKSKRASSLTSETDVFRESRLDRPQGATLSEEAKEVPEKLEDRSSIAGKRQEKRADGSFDPNSSDLMHKLQILSSVVAKRDGRSSISEELTLESRSLRMRRAKEDFLSRRGGPLFHSVMEPSTFDDRNFSGGVTRADLAERDGRSEPEKSAGASTTARRRRVEVEEAGKGDEIDASSGSDVSLSDRAKSASTGMINVDPDIFQRLTEAGRGCESLPRTSSRLQKPGGSLAKIVNKCKFIRLICGKEQSDLSTIARLCRQSLLIDIKNDFEKHWEDDERTNKAPREE
ncbi:uncharacterized protein LOC117227200 isoform X1 [Megalopta genalis]|uniref:uncharacterized protein LOC117227200 isoform X1 n=1 Tax=Megalopta genalis TaxID=115081 RepID=UPI003FD3E0A3